MDEGLEVSSKPFFRFTSLDQYLMHSHGYQNMDAKVTVESIPVLQSGNNDPWKDYSFV
jgi:hypothetical protein